MQPGAELPSFSLLGRRIYAGPAAEVIEFLLKPVVVPRVVCVANVHTLVSGLWDRELGRVQDGADLSLADGRPLSLAGKISGAWETGQLRGPDLMVSLARAGVARKVSHYYYGGSPGVPQAVARCMKGMASGMKVGGAEAPPFGELDDAALGKLVRRLRRGRIGILWLGLGAPKQEKLMARLARLGAPCVMVGVGAGFDYFAGTKPQAPRWMMPLALEWLFRLASEPGRLWKRYLVTNPVFVCLFLAEYFGLYPASAQDFAQRLLRLACLPPLLAAMSQGRLASGLAALLMPAWLGRLFWLAKH